MLFTIFFKCLRVFHNESNEVMLLCCSILKKIRKKNLGLIFCIYAVIQAILLIFKKEDARNFSNPAQKAAVLTSLTLLILS